MKAEKTVDHGWSVVQQVMAMLQEQRAHGLKGRIRFMKERKTWRVHGAFENVEMAEKVLEARRRGESLDQVFGVQREELKKVGEPKMNVVDEMHIDDSDGKGDMEKHRVKRPETGNRLATA